MLARLARSRGWNCAGSHPQRHAVTCRNLPAFIRWFVVGAVTVIGYVFPLNRWPVP